ncbi:MAG: glycosyltransferase [bacterium]|nr:glycosyltransferase [bacterium]
MTDTPLVSVVMAAYNNGQYVQDAAESVLAQDYPALELVIVNDGSEDDTRQVLAHYDDDDRVTVIHQENAGQTVAKNNGLKAARGDLIAFCDADNVWLPGKLARQVPALLARPEVGVVYGEIDLIDGDGNALPPDRRTRHSGRITAPLLLDNFVNFNTTLVRGVIIRGLGGFDERLRMGIDYELWLRISVDHEFLYQPESAVGYRIWGGQMSHRTGERMENFFRLLENFLARHPGLVTKAQANRAWAHGLTTRGYWLASVGRRGEAWADYRRALGHRPHDHRLWRCIAKLLVGRT